MGDRTYVQLVIHPSDLDKDGFKEFLESEGETTDEYTDPNVWVCEEGNYGLVTPIARLAESGVRFYGWHGSGGEYPAMDFFHDGDGTVYYELDEVWPSRRMIVDFFVSDLEDVDLDMPLPVPDPRTYEESFQLLVRYLRLHKEITDCEQRERHANSEA